MTTSLITPQLQTISSIKQRIATEIDSMMASLPEIKDLRPEQRRGMIARYTAVLEGNFIYWMTATYLSVTAEDAKPVIIDNLREECGDSHPAMMRRFAVAAHAFPTDKDAFAIQDEMTSVRLFLGRLSGVQNVLTMAYFEGFIQQFMVYLAELAKAQGSTDFEYTDVHGVCDIAHTEGLFVALEAEMKANPPAAGTDIWEGVDLLGALVQKIVHSPAAEPVVA
jgi:Iron-containing redox enzyme